METIIYFFDPPYLSILVNWVDTSLKVSFLHGLGIITTWVMQLFVMSMMISNVLNNNHDHMNICWMQVFIEGKD